MFDEKYNNRGVQYAKAYFLAKHDIMFLEAVERAVEEAMWQEVRIPEVSKFAEWTATSGRFAGYLKKYI